MKKIFAILILASMCMSCSFAKHSGILVAKDSKPLDGYDCENESILLYEDKSGSTQYRVYQQAPHDFYAMRLIRLDVEQQALMHCEGLGKTLRINQEIFPPFGKHCLPRLELIFTCLLKSDISTIEDQSYTRLTNLKNFFYNGTITKDEFEQRKLTIMNEK